MQLSDIISVVAVLIGAVVSLYLALISGDYVIAIVVGLALPILAALVTWLTDAKKALIGAALVVGLAVIGIAFLTTWKEGSALAAYLTAIDSKNEKYSKRDYPPLPMTIPNGNPIYVDHLSAFRRNKPTLAFLAAPAGAGKSVVIQQMVGKSYQETPSGTVYLQLSEIKEKPNVPRPPDVYGTQVGLGKVPTLNNASDSEATGLFTMICLSQFRAEKLSDQIAQQWPFSRRTSDANQRRFAEVCKDRLERQAESKAGLRIFIDDTDEIEEDSLLQLMTLIDREVSTPSTNHRNLLILLAGRAEVLYTSSRERRSLWDESRQKDAPFLLVTAMIERMPLNSPFFKPYMDSCMKFTLEDSTTRDKIVANVNHTLPLSKNLRESMEYLEGCRFVANHFLNLYEKHEPFSDIRFAKDFYNSWRDRAYEKHRLPSIEQSKAYENLLTTAAAELDHGGGEANFHVGLRVLLYSGLVDVIPVKFASREYRVKFQFPQFGTALLRPPWMQKPSENRSKKPLRA